MLTINPIKRRDWLLLALVLLCAAVVRFGQPGIVEFFHDDAMLSTLAQQMAAGEYFPVTGINSSVGIPNPPTSVYVMAIPFFFDRNPMTAIYFVMGLNVIGVGLLWLIAQRYFGRTVALVAGLSYALSPWAALYSRKIWAQDFHTPFVLLGILLGLYGFWEAKRRSERPTARGRLTAHEWAQVFALPTLLFAFQIHFAAWALIPVYLMLLVMGWRRISWRALVLSGLLSVLVLLPYAVGFWQTYQRNPGQVRPGAVSTLADESQAFSLQSLEYLTYLATGLGLETWVAPQQQAEMNSVVPPLALWWLIGAMVLPGTGLLWRKHLRMYAPLLLAWAYLPALALIPQWAGVYPHYFIASIPALMLLAGVGVAWLAQVVPVQPYGRSIILASYFLLLLTQGIYWRGALRFVDEVEIAYPGFTVPLHYLHDVEEALAEYDDVVVLSDGMSWDLHHESAVWPVLLRDSATCVRTLIGDGYAVFPAGSFVALQAPNMPEDGIGKLYQVDDPLVFPARSEEETYIVHPQEGAPQWDGLDVTPVPPTRYEGDVQLTGYGADANRVLLEWQLPAPSPGLDYQYGVHFYDAEGNKLGQTDTTFWHGRHWCTGDRLLTWMHVEVPPQTTELRVFLYRLGNANEPRYINAMVLDEGGTPIRDHTVIELPE